MRIDDSWAAFAVRNCLFGSGNTPNDETKASSSESPTARGVDAPSSQSRRTEGVIDGLRVPAETDDSAIASPAEAKMLMESLRRQLLEEVLLSFSTQANVRADNVPSLLKH